MRPVIFLGTNSNLEVATRICKLCDIPVAGIVDSDWFGNCEQKNGLSIIGSEKTFDFESARHQYDFFIGSGFAHQDPRSRNKRQAYMKLIDDYSLQCATLIHPKSEIFDDVSLGPGCLISFGAGISHHVNIGAHSQIHSNSLIAHHSTVGTNTIIHTSVVIGSYVKIGNDVVIHPRASIVRTDLDGPTVGNGSEIHPCVAVARSVEPNEVIGLAGSNSRRIYRDVVRQ